MAGMQTVVDQLAIDTQKLWETFLVHFKSNVGKPVPDYLEQIDIMLKNEMTTIYVDFNDVLEYSTDEDQLATALESHYLRLDPYLRKGVQNVVNAHFANMPVASDPNAEFWIAFYGLPAINKIRALKTNRIGTLLSISATITRTSEVRPELLYGAFECADCKVLEKDVQQQFRYTEPIVCKNKASCNNRNRWNLKVDQSKFVDWQRVRVQENPSEIPSGSMPRSMDIILRNEAVEKAKPGDKSIFTGTLIVIPDISQLSLPGTRVQSVSSAPAEGQGQSGNEEGLTGLKALGVRDLTYKLAFLACAVRPADNRFGTINIREDEDDESVIADQFTADELEDIMAMRDDEKLYENLVNSICPTVYGHDEVKRGMLLMLFGGVHKVTPEGINLRGDINVCIVGDPSTSKSQFLKYIVSFLPRAIYTSGKASSAAGLTACVAKDPDSGEFNIEAGALMLADNGICCIDEFDKMDLKDQVSIHEAMEQQTISISKAGIQATLNARTSILAAANPIGGRYDKSKTLKSNLNITPPIMSRFDLFFVVLDECDEKADLEIAKHIVKIHQRKENALRPIYSTVQLQRYIKFARSTKPTILPESEEVFVSEFTRLRQNDLGSAGKSAFRITVRQLESMVRLSEALARLHCDDYVRPEYVKEAARLLRKSLIHVETNDVVLNTNSFSRSKGKTDASKSENSKPKTQNITFSEYTSITNQLVTYLRKQEAQGVEGITIKDLIGWYTKLHATEYKSESDLSQAVIVLKGVITRLVKADHILVSFKSKDGGENILQVSPNYSSS